MQKVFDFVSENASWFYVGCAFVAGVFLGVVL